MTHLKPHYLLFCDGNVPASGESAGSQRGRWRFVLENLVSGERIEATDQEISCAPDRSALVAVLRGLEALEQPSKVTLVTTSRYVTRGLQYGLSEWRENDYSWEHFGTVQPIRNADIWRRIDRALAYHQVQCRWMAAETSTDTADESADETAETTATKLTSPSVPVSQLQSTDSTSVSAIRMLNPPAAQTAAIAARNGTAPNLYRPSRTQDSRTRDTQRTSVSTSNYQRVYVDTPLAAYQDSGSLQNHPMTAHSPLSHAAVNGSIVDSLFIAAGKTSKFDLASHSSSFHQNASTQESSRFSKRVFSGLLALFAPIARPLVWAFRGPIRHCRHAWDMILTVDEWLESYLRCFLLLDPIKKSTRHQLEPQSSQRSDTPNHHHSV